MNRLKRAAALALAAVLCLTLLAACGEKEEGLSLSVCVGETPNTLDPAMATESADETILMQLYENLMRVTCDAAGNLTTVGGMAKTVDVDEHSDGTVSYTFHLRKAQWSDGTALTAEDFVYAWQRLVNPATKSPNARLLSTVQGYDAVRSGGEPSELAVTAKNDTTLVVVLNGKYDWFVTDVCSAAATLPLRQDVVGTLNEIAYQKNQEAEANGESRGFKWWSDPTELVTNGAYTVSEYVPGESLLTQASETYYGKAGPARITYRFAADTAEAWSLYQAKEVDFVSPLPEERLAELAKDELWSPVPELSTFAILFNTGAEPLDDPLIRRALSLSLDRGALAQTAGVTAQGATGLVPYGVPDSGQEDFRTVGGALIDCRPGHYEENCASAKTLLEDAGYDSGRNITSMDLLYEEGDAMAPVLEAAARMWSSALQVTVTPRAVSESELAQALTDGTYTMAAVRMEGFANDAENFLLPFRSDRENNVVGYANSAYDTLLAIIDSASDGAARLACLHDAESLLLEDGALTPLLFTGTYWDLQDDLTGVCRDSRGWFSFLGIHERTA